MALVAMRSAIEGYFRRVSKCSSNVAEISFRDKLKPYRLGLAVEYADYTSAEG